MVPAMPLIRGEGDLRATVLSPALRPERRGRYVTPVSRLGLAYYARAAGLVAPDDSFIVRGGYACAAGAAFGLATSLRAGARMACKIVPSMRGMNSTIPASPMSWMSRLMIL